MLLRIARTRGRDAKLEALRRLPALDSSTDRELLGLAAAADLVHYPAQTVLTREGEPAREAFLVVEGEVRVLRQGVEVARLGAGDLVGEIGLLDRRPRPAGVEAVTPVEAAVFGRAAFHRLVQASPWFNRKLLAHLAGRARFGVPT